MNDGVYRAYYPGGAIFQEQNYRNTELDGVAREYYENGKLKALTTYAGGSREGEAEDGAGEGGDEDREEDGRPAEAGADGAEELDVAHAHGLALEDEAAEGGDEPEEAVAEGEADEGMEERGEALGLALEGGEGDGEEKAGGHAAERDAVGQDEMVEVHERAEDQGAGEKDIDGREERPAVDEPQAGEQRAGEQFDDEVARGDGGLAVAALAAEEEPREQRNIVPRRDGVVAGGAVGAGPGNGFVARDAPDADVEEAADAEPGKEDEDRNGGVGLWRKGRHRLRAFRAFSRAARIVATGGLRPVQRRKARTPWCRSMPRPLAVRAPAAWAAASSGVTAGL